MIIFKTSTAILKLMWDIALVYFITRIAFFYWLLTLLVFSLIGAAYNSPNPTTTPTNSSGFTVKLLAITLISRLIIYYCDVPRVLGFRLAIGLLASLFSVLANLLATAIALNEGFGSWIWQNNRTGMFKEVVEQCIFGLMPAVWMLNEEHRAKYGKSQPKMVRKTTTRELASDK